MNTNKKARARKITQEKEGRKKPGKKVGCDAPSKKELAKEKIVSTIQMAINEAIQTGDADTFFRLTGSRAK